MRPKNDGELYVAVVYLTNLVDTIIMKCNGQKGIFIPYAPNPVIRHNAKHVYFAMRANIDTQSKEPQPLVTTSTRGRAFFGFVPKGKPCGHFYIGTIRKGPDTNEDFKVKPVSRAVISPTKDDIITL